MTLLFNIRRMHLFKYLRIVFHNTRISPFSFNFFRFVHKAIELKIMRSLKLGSTTTLFLCQKEDNTGTVTLSLFGRPFKLKLSRYLYPELLRRLHKMNRRLTELGFFCEKLIIIEESHERFSRSRLHTTWTLMYEVQILIDFMPCEGIVG